MISENIIISIGIFLISMIAHVIGVDVTIDTQTANEDIFGKNEAVEYHRVVRIVDGDTFDVENGERVRMIGIDTPERGEYYYTEAKEHLAELISDKRIYLTKDISERDRYGRLLRHVYVDDMWINEKMIKDGFAHAVTFPPDVMHADIFREAEKDARENKRGLWDK